MFLRVFIAVMMLTLGFALSGCMTSEQIEEARQQQREESPYYATTPYGEAFIKSNPRGAQIEMMDDFGIWREVGSTPTTEPLILEANGRGYIFRLRKEGYKPVRATLALGPRQKKQTFVFDMVESIGGDTSPSVVSRTYAADLPQRSPELHRVKNQKLWYQTVPHGEATIISSPADAVVRLYRDGQWQIVGTASQDSPIVLEATGRHYRIRLSKPGYLPMDEWIYLTGSQPKRTFRFNLIEDLAGTEEAQYELRQGNR